MVEMTLQIIRTKLFLSLSILNFYFGPFSHSTLFQFFETFFFKPHFLIAKVISLFRVPQFEKYDSFVNSLIFQHFFFLIPFRNPHFFLSLRLFSNTSLDCYIWCSVLIPTYFCLLAHLLFCLFSFDSLYLYAPIAIYNTQYVNIFQYRKIFLILLFLYNLLRYLK